MNINITWDDLTKIVAIFAPNLIAIKSAITLRTLN